MREQIAFLRKFLGYELNTAERYRRFCSLVMVHTSDGNGAVKRILNETLRNSDVMADHETGTTIILMSETNSAGALTAIERYKVKNDGAHDLRFSLVTYPSDGGGPEGLLDTGHRRLESAITGEEGSVVMSG